jgi:ribonuclease D
LNSVDPALQAAPLPLAPFHLVADRRGWLACLRNIEAAPHLAIDLEANSMFAYTERVCLIQISTAGADYIIDPVKYNDLDELGDILADPAIEKVFHASEYDLILLRRDYGWQLNNLFDTMWAARILGYSQIGLGNLLEKFFNVHTSKRFQKANWCRRPLSAPELAYAQMDTHYLLAIRDRLVAELATAGCLAEAREIFNEQSRVRLPNNGFDPDGFWNMNGAQEMPPAKMAALKALYIFRDREAKRRNAPVFKVLSDRTLLELANAMPAHMGELSRIHGMSAGQQQRYGRTILDLIADAYDAPVPQPPKRAKRPPDSVLNRYDRLHRWRKDRARARGVESDVIMSRDALWAIAHSAPKTMAELADLNVLGPWRLMTYGLDVLRLV